MTTPISEKMNVKSFIAALALLLAFWAPDPAKGQSSLDEKPDSTPERTLQLVLVSVPIQNESNATLRCLSRDSSNAQWRQDLPSIPTKIGRGGLADYGEMSEWGAKTPRGEFDLGFLCGVESEPPEGVALAYRQTTVSDFWIDEADAPNYNQWVSGSEPKESHERLILGDYRYDLVVPINYNVNPTTPRKGSAIFFHLWKDESTATGGCVAISRDNMLAVLRWLDPKKSPRMRIDLESAR